MATGNFNDKQLEMWRWAQYAANRALNKSNREINIPPDWFYRQWVHEAGNDFNSNPELAQFHNYGGLKDTKGNFRAFLSPSHYADAFVDDFILLRPELKDAKTMDDYIRIMHETGYMTDADKPAEYLADMKNVIVPNTKTELKNSSALQYTPRQSLLNLPQDNHAIKFAQNSYQLNQYNQPPTFRQIMSYAQPQNQTPPPVQNYSPVARSDQYLPQVNMAAWIPYNNFRVPSETVNALKNNFGGFLRNIRGLFK